MARRRKTNAEYSAETQGHLVAAARMEFARVGYAGTATERIVDLAGVTRGALYHHYRGKRELFEAVFAELQREIATRIEERSTQGKDGFENLVAGCEAWLDACLDADVQQIVLLDGPAVLGWRRWIEIDARYSARLLREGIDVCIEAGLLVDVDGATLTRALSGAMNELALHLAQSPNTTKNRRTAGRTMHALLKGLLA